jgi:hypothetical protein
MVMGKVLVNAADNIERASFIWSSESQQHAAGETDLEFT